MKNFDKWFNKKQSPEEILKVSACITSENLIDMIAETAWRAALEEVLKQLNNIYDGDFENSEIVKWIKKEIEE